MPMLSAALDVPRCRGKVSRDGGVRRPTYFVCVSMLSPSPGLIIWKACYESQGPLAQGDPREFVKDPGKWACVYIPKRYSTYVRTHACGLLKRDILLPRHEPHAHRQSPQKEKHRREGQWQVVRTPGTACRGSAAIHLAISSRDYWGRSDVPSASLRRDEAICFGT